MPEPRGTRIVLNSFVFYQGLISAALGDIPRPGSLYNVIKSNGHKVVITHKATRHSISGEYETQAPQAEITIDTLIWAIQQLSHEGIIVEVRNLD